MDGTVNLGGTEAPPKPTSAFPRPSISALQWPYPRKRYLPNSGHAACTPSNLHYLPALIPGVIYCLLPARSRQVLTTNTIHVNSPVVHVPVFCWFKGELSLLLSAQRFTLDQSSQGPKERLRQPPARSLSSPHATIESGLWHPSEHLAQFKQQHPQSPTKQLTSPVHGYALYTTQHGRQRGYHPRASAYFLLA